MLDFADVIGPNGFDNRNLKGVWALQWLSLFNMKATNTFFTHKEYTTHTSYLPPSLPQMLDIFSISSSSFKRVRDCALSDIGILSDHAAICLRLAISTIAHTGGTKLAKSQID